MKTIIFSIILILSSYATYAGCTARPKNCFHMVTEEVDCPSGSTVQVTNLSHGNAVYLQVWVTVPGIGQVLWGSAYSECEEVGMV